VTPGLGKWMVTIAAWLFALSTMISWSYYGEQGVYFLCGNLSEKATSSIVFFYKLIYAALILLTTALAMPVFDLENGKGAIIGTDHELDNWTTLGLGVMLVANIPIMLIFGAKAMKTYHTYFRRMKAGGDDPHDAPPISDVMEGRDVE
ncbi:MAG: alanine:cation symporter family protein, partial [Phycisphaerales bacterium]|nr:alanine:cation symporter family protein [Phycisphaerales bacterium]